MKDGLLGDTIRQARMDNKMTQEQLAEAINISPTHMKHIESEHRKPSVDVLFSLADVLSFSMDAMLMETQSTDHAKRVNEINLLMNKCTDEALDIFLARDLKKTHQHLDPDEEIEVEAWELSDLLKRIYAGELTDGKTVSAILAYACKAGQK